VITAPLPVLMKAVLFSRTMNVANKQTHLGLQTSSAKHDIFVRFTDIR